MAIRSAAATFLCPVPRARTDACPGSPAQSIAERALNETNNAPTAIAPLPNVPSMAEKFNPKRSTTAAIMLTFDTGPKIRT